MMSPAPSLTVLRALKSLAVTGNVSRTAQALGLTQSAVSRAIANYEKTIGLTLLQREARPLTLTEAGQLVVARATEIDHSLDALNEQLLALRQNRTGHLRIGSFGPTASTRILPDLLNRVARAHPGITISIQEASDDTTREEVARGLTDLAILSNPVEEFDAIALATDELVALVPENWDTPPSLSAAELAAAPFIMTLAGSEPTILSWFQASGLQPEIQHRIQQTHSILELVRCGQGLAVVAALALPRQIDGVRALPLQPPSEREVYLVKKTGVPRSPAVTAVWSIATSFSTL
ncbi:LysR family transcriptional regulator [Roseovarius sp. B08]|uniref:LysR family transcriptional regulator n=1 Tax=Roseovarius sp. B08 TaxID=3449223 RepID=UPI003EDC52E1